MTNLVAREKNPLKCPQLDGMGTTTIVPLITHQLSTTEPIQFT
jgi:hypothetical protein